MTEHATRPESATTGIGFATVQILVRLPCQGWRGGLDADWSRTISVEMRNGKTCIPVRDSQGEWVAWMSADDLRKTADILDHMKQSPYEAETAANHALWDAIKEHDGGYDGKYPYGKPAK